MASYSSVGASQDWLFRATAKLEKSIFRRVEYKYKNKLNDLYNLCKKLEDEANLIVDVLLEKDSRIVELENLLAPFINPTVSLKNLEKEVFRVSPFIEKTAHAEKLKRKFEESEELIEIIELREAPVSKILKVGPAPRSIFPLPTPVTPKKKSNNNRGRSGSPKPIPTPSKPLTMPKKSEFKRDRSTSPLPQPQHHPLVMKRFGDWKKRKKDKEDKEKDN